MAELVQKGRHVSHHGAGRRVLQAVLIARMQYADNGSCARRLADHTNFHPGQKAGPLRCSVLPIIDNPTPFFCRNPPEPSCLCRFQTALSV